MCILLSADGFCHYGDIARLCRGQVLKMGRRRTTIGNYPEYDTMESALEFHVIFNYNTMYLCHYMSEELGYCLEI